MASESTWTAEQITTLTAEWAAGKSARAIGLLIGMPKNAVIGKAHRLNLPSRPSPIRPTRPLSGQTGKRGCQYIAGEPRWTLHGDAIYCGDTLQHGSSFCPVHHARCWHQGDERAEWTADPKLRRVFG